MTYLQTYYIVFYKLRQHFTILAGGDFNVANAKIDFTIGNISFSGEGEETWLASQLDKIIDKAPDLIKIAPSPQVIAEVVGSTTTHEAATADAAIAAHTLPSFLRDKNATRAQTRKFLVPHFGFKQGVKNE